MPKVIVHGIVLSAIKYGESSLIVTLYTKEMGRLSTIVSISSSAQSKRLKQPLLTPLSIIEASVSDVKKIAMKRLSDAHLEYIFRSIPFDVVKRSIAIFLADLFYHASQEAIPDEKVYLFFRQSIEALDQDIDGVSNFHILIMFNLARLLGFAPDTGDDRCAYFDLVEGSYKSRCPLHSNVLVGDELALWRMLCRTNVDNLATLDITSDQRQILLEILEKYYALHIPQFKTLKSRSVLRDVLR
ncbi:MAG: DNA repair protein RecO [Bacteroidia bacterium]|nr:DNA repair protein RecO [Bacteroidia bacterium]